MTLSSSKGCRKAVGTNDVEPDLLYCQEGIRCPSSANVYDSCIALFMIQASGKKLKTTLSFWDLFSSELMSTALSADVSALSVPMSKLYRDHFQYAPPRVKDESGSMRRRIVGAQY